MVKLLLLTVFAFGAASANLDGIGIVSPGGDMQTVMTFFNVIPSPFSSPLANLSVEGTMFYMGMGAGSVLTLNGTYVYFISGGGLASFDKGMQVHVCGR